MAVRLPLLLVQIKKYGIESFVFSGKVTNRIKKKQLCLEIIKVVQYIDYCLIVFYRHETVEKLHYKFNAFLVKKWTP